MHARKRCGISSRYECFDNTGQRSSITKKIMSRLLSAKKSPWAHALSWWCVGSRLLPKYDLEWRVRRPDTRTGRRFFNDSELERAVLDRLISALTSAGFWEKFQSGWFCWNCELMPWSVTAEDLLRTQYAPTGAAANAAVDSARTALNEAECRAGSMLVSR
jgi:hypothetical protein